MTYQGKVTNVELYPTGDKVDQAYAAGSTILVMTDTTDFQETGGQVSILGQTYTYTAMDSVSGSLFLSTGLSSAIDEGEDVLVYPPTREKRALVLVGDEADAVVATIPHSMADRMDVGIREETDQESVTLEVINGVWKIQDVVALDPLILGQYVDPNSMPPISDGLPPPAPSAPSLYSALGTITYTWNGLDSTGVAMPVDFAEVRVYMGTASGFTTDSTTYLDHLLGPGSGVVTKQPGGATRYFKLRAIDKSGNLGPESAEVSVVVQRITGPDLQAGSVTTNELQAGSVGAQQLAAVIALISKLASAVSGRRWEADQFGIRLYDVDESLLVQLSTDPTTPNSFVGDLVASSLTVTDQLAIRGLVNEISKGSQVVLSGGTTAPTTPPTVSVEWPLQTWAAQSSDTSWGLALFNGNWITVHRLGGVSTGITLEKYSPSGAYVGKLVDLVDTSYARQLGLATLGSTLYVLTAPARVLNGVGYRVLGLGSAGEINSDVTINIGAGYATPRIATDGALLILGMTRVSDNHFVYQKYTTAGVASGALVDTGLVVPNGTDPSDLYYGPSDLGSDRLVAVFDRTATAYSFTSAGVRAPNDDFPLVSTSPAGIAWDSTNSKFLELTQSSTLTNGLNVYDHSGIKWTTESSTWWLSQTWYDSDAGGTGTHETTQGTRKSFTMKKRAYLRVTIPPYPPRPTPDVDDVVAARVYLGRATTDPGRAAMQLNWTLAIPTISTGLVSSATFGTSTVPPATNNFPAANPAKITSADGTSLILQGDGTFTVGPFSKDSSGNVVLAEPGWTAATLANTWANYGAPFQNAGYRKLTNGKVELRGLVKNGAIQAAIFTLPVGMRPSTQMVFIGIAGVSGGLGFARIDVFSTGIVWVQAYGSGGTNAYVSLDGITFDPS